MAQAKNLVSLTREQFNTLVTNGTLTANGVTIEFNENDIYLTPQPSYYEQVDGVVMPTEAGTLATQEWVNANGGEKYLHTIQILIRNYHDEDLDETLYAYISFTIPNSSAIAMTKEQVIDWLNDHVYNTPITCNGFELMFEGAEPGNPISQVSAKYGDVNNYISVLISDVYYNVLLTDSSVEIEELDVKEF